MDTTTDQTRDLQNEFKELPFESKVATLFQLEVITVSEAFETVADTAAILGKKLFDAVAPPDCSADQAQPESTGESAKE